LNLVNFLKLIQVWNKFITFQGDLPKGYVGIIWVATEIILFRINVRRLSISARMNVCSRFIFPFLSTSQLKHFQFGTQRPTWNFESVLSPFFLKGGPMHNWTIIYVNGIVGCVSEIYVSWYLWKIYKSLKNLGLIQTTILLFGRHGKFLHWSMFMDEFINERKYGSLVSFGWKWIEWLIIYYIWNANTGKNLWI